MKKLFIMCLILTLFFSFASVSAGDINETMVSIDDSDLVSIEEPINQNNVEINHENDGADDKISTSESLSDVIGTGNNNDSLTFSDDNTISATSPRLEEIIKNAKNGDVIEIGSNYTLYEEISIDKDLVINGNNHMFNGAFGSFTIEKNVVVSFNNINFKGFGDNDASSAGAFNNKGTLIIKNCIFDYCYIKNYGGAIYNDGSLTIRNCSFERCYASSSGGVSYGGAIYNSRWGKLNIDDCSFERCYSNSEFGSSNSASSKSYGGAIYSESDKPMIIKNSKFIDCFVKSAAYSHSSSAGSYSSSSYSYGGAIYTKYGTLTIDNCSFVNCYSNSRAQSTGAYSPGVYYSSSYSYGGAIYKEDGYTSIGNSSFVNCYCISNSDAFSLSGGIMYSTNSPSRGGAIYNGGNLTVSGCGFVNNSAYKGEAIYDCNEKNVNITHNLFLKNGVTSTNSNFDFGLNCWLNTQKPNVNEWIIYDLIFDNDIITYNENSSFKFGFYRYTDGENYYNFETPLFINLNYNFIVDKAIITYNSTSDCFIYSPIDIGQDELNIYIENQLICNHSIVITITTEYLQNLVDSGNNNVYFTDNCNLNEEIILNKTISIDGNKHVLYGNNTSRGMKIIEDNVVIKNLKFINFSSDIGGAILVLGKNCTIINCTFVNCTASQGSAIYWNETGGNINQCIFINNEKNNVVYSTVADTNLSTNYWGNNNPMKNIDYNQGIFENWIVMDIQYSYHLEYGLNTTFWVQLYRFTNGTSYFKLNRSLRDDFHISAKEGIIQPNITQFKFVYSPTKAGEDTIVVSMYGVNCSILAINVPKATPSLSLIINNNTNINTNITAIISDNIEGNIIFTIGNITEPIKIVNNTATLVLHNLNAGECTVFANYIGDNNYNPAYSNMTFNVTKPTPNLRLNIEDSVYSKSIKITTSLYGLNNTGLTANLTLNIYGKSYTISVVNGTGFKEVHDIFNARSYTGIVTFHGDENYDEISVRDDFTIGKAKPDLNISVGDRLDNGDIVITVNVSSGITGRFTFVIGNKKETKNFVSTNGIIKWTTPFLTAGSYTINISYGGDNNYNASETSQGFIAKDFNISSFTLLNRVISELDLNVINLNDNILKNIEEFNSFKSGISINKNVVINGNGHTIDANGNGRIFNVYNTGNLTITNCTFIRCDKITNGAAIYNKGNLNIINCNFSNNYAEERGGSIYNYDDGNMAISGCNFVNCSAFYYGGAINNYGNLNINFSSFTNCSSKNSAGGAIDTSGKLVVYECSFINCSNNAIYSRNDLNISFSNFINCSASSGGAIGNSGKLVVYGCSFINCSATNQGGAIYIYRQNDIEISFNSFINCLDKDSCPVYSSKGEFEYNWWGTNNPSWSFAKNWIVMYTDYTLPNNVGNKDIVINVDFNHYYDSKNNIITELNKPFNSDFEVEFSSNTGTLNCTSQKTKNGKISVKYSTDYGENNINIYTFNETKNINFNIEKYSLGITAPNNSVIDYGENTTIVFSLNNVVDDNATIILMKDNVQIDSKQVKLNKNILYDIENKSAGTYKVIFQFNENKDYKSESLIITVTVNKINPKAKLDVNNIYHGDIFNANLTMISSSNGSVTFIINDDKYEKTIPLSNATSKFSIFGLNSGNYSIKAIYNGDENYNSITKSASFKVLPQVIVKHTGNDTYDIQEAINLANPGETIILGSNYKYVVTPILVDKSITIIGGENMSISSLKNSEIFRVSLNCENLNIYDVNFIATMDNTKFISVASEEDSIGISKVPQILMTRNKFDIAEGVNPTSVTVLSVQTQSKNFIPTNTINISGNSLSKDITISNVGTVDSATGNLVVKFSKLITYFETSNPTIKTYPNSGWFTFTLKDVNGNPIVGKSVSYNFNGKLYSGITNANGQVTFKISLNKAGSYKITCMFEGDNTYKGSTFTKTIKVSKNSVKFVSPTKKIKKSQAKKAKFKITLKTSNNKVLAKKYVFIKINKKTYKAKTNAKGVVTFKLKLANKKMNYKYTITFKGDAGNYKKTYSGKLKVY